MIPGRRCFATLMIALGLVSGLGGGARAAIVLQTPAGLNPGDHFRFVFVSDGSRDAMSTNIADYDTFVNAQAQAATYNGALVNWLAIASTDSVDAIDHIGQTDSTLYLSNGTPVTSSATATGLWSGALAHQIDLDLAGSVVPPINFVWTGTNPTGTGFGGPLGSATPQTGANTDTGGSWTSSGRSPSGDLRNLYGISSELVVSAGVVPEPETLSLVGAGLGAGFAIGWRRRRRREGRR